MRVPAVTEPENGGFDPGAAGQQPELARRSPEPASAQERRVGRGRQEIVQTRWAERDDGHAGCPGRDDTVQITIEHASVLAQFTAP